MNWILSAALAAVGVGGAAALVSMMADRPLQSALFVATVANAPYEATVLDLLLRYPFGTPLALLAWWFVCSTFVNVAGRFVVATTSFVLRSVKSLAHFVYLTVPGTVVTTSLKVASSLVKLVLKTCYSILKLALKAIRWVEAALVKMIAGIGMALLATVKFVLVTIPNKVLDVVDPGLAFLLITVPGFIFELVFNAVEAIVAGIFMAVLALAKALHATMKFILVTIPNKVLDVVDPVLAFLLITTPGCIFKLVFDAVEAIVVGIFKIVAGHVKALHETVKLILVTIPNKILDVVDPILAFLLITVPDIIFELVFNAVEATLTAAFNLVYAVVAGALKLIVGIFKLALAIIRFVTVAVISVLRFFFVTVPSAVVSALASVVRSAFPTRKRAVSGKASFIAYRKRRRSRHALAMRSWERERKNRAA